MEVETTPPKEKKTRKASPPLYAKFIVVPFSEDHLEMLEAVEFAKEDEESGKEMVDTIPFEVREIRIKKNEKEKTEATRVYRAEYKTRPKVIEKAKAHAQDPEVKKKNREYSRLPEIRERKKELQKRNRAVRKKLKEEDPVLYAKYMEEVMARLHSPTSVTVNDTTSK